jgi:hypothetical protein
MGTRIGNDECQLAKRDSARRNRNARYRSRTATTARPKTISSACYLAGPIKRPEGLFVCSFVFFSSCTFSYVIITRAVDVYIRFYYYYSASPSLPPNLARRRTESPRRVHVHMVFSSSSSSFSSSTYNLIIVIRTRHRSRGAGSRVRWRHVIRPRGPPDHPMILFTSSSFSSSLVRYKNDFLLFFFSPSFGWAPPTTPPPPS